MNTTQRILVLVVISQTRLAYEYFKEKSTDTTRFAAIWPVAFVVVELALAIVLGLTSPHVICLRVVLGYFAAIRIVEILWAYSTDPMSSLRGDPKSTALGAVDRIRFAMMSYCSLIILWATLYFSLSFESFTPCLSEFVDALYFSGVTITTLGYGDISPHVALTKLLCIAQVFSGMLVIIVAVGSYLAGTSKPAPT